MSSERACILCRRRPAELPDRERMGRPIKRVCRECHRERLRGDMARVVDGGGVSRGVGRR